jgi:hypothetical protein
LPFFAEEQLPMLRILTDRGAEYCGRAETHDYQLQAQADKVLPD